MELEKKTEGTVDFTKYPEGMDEIIKHLDFLPDDYNLRKGIIWGMISMSLFY